MKTAMTTLIIKPNAPITSNPIFTGIGIISKWNFKTYNQNK